MIEAAQEFRAGRRPDVPSCLVLDVELPGLSGLDLQQELNKGDVRIPIIFMTGHGDIPMTVRAMKAGAVEFLTKPCRDEDLLGAIEQAISRRRVETPGFGEIVGTSEALRRVITAVETVAPTDATVLVCGETGTGKELVARAIHATGRRSARPFVKLNCSAIPAGLLESELFGHEKGAFTGAVAQHVGRFELAHGGTLFLDEIGDLPLALQPKLLRVLQEQEFERLGSTRTTRVDVRLIAATNADLATIVAEKRFREDLYYRFAVFPIVTPPLRERREDIPALARHFVDRYSRRMNKRIETISAAAMTAMTEYHWPGNVRELANVLERAVIVCTVPVLDPEHLGALATPSRASTNVPVASANPSDAMPLAAMEKLAIVDAFRRANGNKSRAAALLGVSRMSSTRGSSASVWRLAPACLNRQPHRLESRASTRHSSRTTVWCWWTSGPHGATRAVRSRRSSTSWCRNREAV